MEQDPPPQASAAELSDLLDKSERAHIDALGGALHTIAHPIKYGAESVAVAGFTLALTGFGYLATNLVRLSLAADRRKALVDDLMKKYPDTPPPAEAP